MHRVSSRRPRFAEDIEVLLTHKSKIVVRCLFFLTLSHTHVISSSKKKTFWSNMSKAAQHIEQIEGLVTDEAVLKHNITRLGNRPKRHSKKYKSIHDQFIHDPEDRQSQRIMIWTDKTWLKIDELSQQKHHKVAALAVRESLALHRTKHWKRHESHALLD